jgi:hypothetical protein
MLAFGTVAVEPERAWDGGVHIWLDPSVLARLKALRGPGESYMVNAPEREQECIRRPL